MLASSSMLAKLKCRIALDFATADSGALPGAIHVPDTAAAAEEILKPLVVPFHRTSAIID
jgi:hypothetical protein